MKKTWWIILMLSIAACFVVFVHEAKVSGHSNDDYAIVNQLVTLKERKHFFGTLSPERKTALWRKHFEAELSQHSELTQAQKEVVNLATVIVNPDVFSHKVPTVCGPGSVFATALDAAFKDATVLRDEIFGQPGQPLPKFAHANKSSSKSEDTIPDCECNRDSSCNSCGGCGCSARMPVCYLQTWGCGCFWASGCNTMCAYCY